MKFYYVISDTVSNGLSLYLIEADDKKNADKIFIKNFLPLLPDTEDTDLSFIENICSDFSYDLYVVKEEDIKILDGLGANLTK